MDRDKGQPGRARYLTRCDRHGELTTAAIEHIRLRVVDARTGNKGTVVAQGAEMMTVDSDDEVVHTHPCTTGVGVRCDAQNEKTVGLLHLYGHPHAKRTVVDREHDQRKVADERGSAEVNPPRRARPPQAITRLRTVASCRVCSHRHGALEEGCRIALHGEQRQDLLTE